jgi:hypothetical protein
MFKKKKGVCASPSLDVSLYQIEMVFLDLAPTGKIDGTLRRQTRVTMKVALSLATGIL